MVRVSLDGRVATDMRETIYLISDKAMGKCTGVMDISTKENGRRDSRTALEN